MEGEKNMSIVSNSSETASITKDSVDNTGVYTATLSLATIFLCFGAMKFTAYEAEAISGLIENSPFLSWLYMIFSKTQVAYILGVIEIFTGIFLALRIVSPAAGAIGALMAVLTYLITFSFFFTTPGVFEQSVGFPAISVMPGQFLLKDLALLGLSIYLLKNALRAVNQRETKSL